MRLRAPCLLLVVALGAAAPVGWQDYAAGHYAEAVSAWSAAAAHGDPNALFGMGLAYDLGQGIGQDERLACSYYRRAADNGIVAAAFNEAALQDAARCGPHDAGATALWYGRAAASMHPRAMYDLGQLYEKGDGVPRNPAMAASWYGLAGAYGLAAAGVRARDLSQAGYEPSAPLAMASLSWPVGDALPDRGIAVPFVWAAPAQPAPVRFYIEVYVLGGAAPRKVAARYVDVSATMVVLPPGAADYAWRVLTVAAGAHRYVASSWADFSVRKEGSAF